MMRQPSTKKVLSEEAAGAAKAADMTADRTEETFGKQAQHFPKGAAEVARAPRRQRLQIRAFAPYSPLILARWVLLLLLPLCP